MLLYCYADFVNSSSIKKNVKKRKRQLIKRLSVERSFLKFSDFFNFKIIFLNHKK